MEYEINNGLIKLVKAGDLELLDCGIEFSDRVSFITLTDIPVRAHIIKKDSQTSVNKTTAKYEIFMAEGHFFLEVNTEVDQENNKLTVAAELIPQVDALIQDFVIRFKVKKNSGIEAKINNNVYTHKNSEKYRQFNTDEASIFNSDVKIKFQRVNQIYPSDCEGHMYVRDIKDYWIVHSRFFPKLDSDNYWFRWINRFFSLSLSLKTSDMLKKVTWLRDFLWYRKERKGKAGLHFQLIGLLPVKRLTPIMQKVEVRIHE